MAKVKVIFDLNDPDDVMSHRRFMQSTDMALAMWEFKNKLWRMLKHVPDDMPDEEYKAKTEFIKKYGTKEWQKVLDIKTEIERLEKEDKKYFDAELSKVKWVQFWCFMAAAWIAYYIVWGSKR